MLRTALALIGGLALALAGCDAKDLGEGSGTPAPKGAAPPQAAANSAKNPDMTGLVETVDADGDGRMSHAEWLAQGLPESSFNMLEKGRGYVTHDDYRDNPAPPGIDLNADGVLTIDEFKEFDRGMSAGMASQGKAPPRP